MLNPEYPITTERLFLRPHRREDLRDLLVFHSDPDVVRYIPWPVRDEAQTRKALESKLKKTTLTDEGQWLVLAVEHRETERVIGEVLLKWQSVHHRQGEVGYAFSREFQGQGMAREAIVAMLTLGFTQLGLHRIEAHIIDGNAASVRLVERLGMRCEGHLHHNAFFKGAWASTYIYALTSDEWSPD